MTLLRQGFGGQEAEPSEAPEERRRGRLALEARGLVKAFKSGRSKVEVLKSVDFHATHGEVSLVMGPSGSGKSTLMACMSGLLRPDEGRVTALGQELWGLGETRIDRFRLDHCGFVFQGFNLFPALTALQQVQVILKYQGVPRDQARERAVRALGEVGMKPRMHQRPAELSGGEKQRVAIARALAKAPRLIFADEPTSALDGENGAIVMRLLHHAAKEKNAAVICVTHDIRLEIYADRVIHLEDGRIVEAPHVGVDPAKPALQGA